MSVSASLSNNTPLSVVTHYCDSHLDAIASLIMQRPDLSEHHKEGSTTCVDYMFATAKSKRGWNISLDDIMRHLEDETDNHLNSNLDVVWQVLDGDGTLRNVKQKRDFFPPGKPRLVGLLPLAMSPAV